VVLSENSDGGDGQDGDELSSWDSRGRQKGRQRWKRLDRATAPRWRGGGVKGVSGKGKKDKIKKMRRRQTSPYHGSVFKLKCRQPGDAWPGRS